MVIIMKHKILAAVLAALVGVSAASCGEAVTAGFEPTAEDKKVVMTVGGRDVQYQEFRYYLLNNRRDSFGGVETLSEEQTEELRSMTEENARYTKAIGLMADKYGVKLSDADIDEVEAVIAEYRATQCQNNNDIYRVALEEQYMTDYLFRKLQQNNKLAYLTIDKMVESGAIKNDDATVDALLESDELLCIKEIYIGYNTEETKKYALSRAEEALESLMNGADFIDVMREYSDYNEASMSPEHGYYTTEYEMPDYIWQTAAGLAEGEHSAIVESEYGYHLVMRCPKDAAYMEEIHGDIFSRYISAMYTKELYETMETLEIVYTDYGASLDLASVS